MKYFKLILVVSCIIGVICFPKMKVYATYNKKDFQKIEDSINILLAEATNIRSQGDYEKALELITKSHFLRLSIFPDTSLAIVKSYFNMANASVRVYEYETALLYLRKAESICMLHEKDRAEEIGTIYFYTGRIYSYIGNYIISSQYLQRANDYFNKEKILDKTKLIVYYTLCAHVELVLDNPEMSLTYYQKSYQIIKGIDHNTKMLLNYYTGSALVYAKSGNYNKSIQLQKTAIKIARNDSTDNALRLAILYNNIGLDYLEIQKLDEAENAFIRSLTIFNNLRVKGSFLAELYENFGRLWFLKGNYTKALQYYQSALKVTAPQMTSDNWMINPDIRQIEAEHPALKILKSKSQCLAALYNQNKTIDYLDGAINTSLLAIELIEQLRNSYQSYEGKLLTIKQEYQVFNNTLDWLSLAYQQTGDSKYSRTTFTVSEKSKSSILLSVLSELDAKQFGEIPDSLLQKEKSLSKSIAFYKENLYEERQMDKPDQAKIDTWERYLFNAQHEHEQLIANFELNYPKYYNLKYDYSVADIRQLQKHLPFRTTLIEYSLSDSVLFTFIVTRNNFFMLQQAIDEDFTNQLNHYVNKFHSFDFSKQSGEDFYEFCQISNTLYNLLIAPATNYVSGQSLIIVPDGILSYLPFETLIKQMPENISANQYRNLDYLINKFSISYSYSATLLNQVSGRQKFSANKRLLAFAPEYSEDENAINSGNRYVTRQNYRKNLFPIPGVIEEVKAINKLIPGDIFLGLQATESNFKDTASYYDILHLAMHTVIDNNNPLYSKLIFTLNQDSSQDGLLNTYEIFTLSLNARMIVLSACSTGGGEFNNGEGVISLARGFVYAGSPSIVMTMWEVEDKSGPELMKYFYKNIFKGQSKSKALRNAKLKSLHEARPENTHPFFWSAFVVMGNPSPLYINKLFIEIIILTGCSLLLLFIFRKRGQKTKAKRK